MVKVNKKRIELAYNVHIELKFIHITPPSIHMIRNYRYGYGNSKTSPSILATTVTWTKPDYDSQIKRLYNDRERKLSEVLNSYGTKVTSKYPTGYVNRRTAENRKIQAVEDNNNNNKNSSFANDNCKRKKSPWSIIGFSCIENNSKIAKTVLSKGSMPVGNSSSRTGRLARISQSNIRPFGSNNSNTNTLSHGAGGHPLAGAEPASPTKKELKHRFEIVKKLGSGTYGKVSLAFDHKFEREVAVKLIKKSAIENKADLIRIRREIRIMSALNHPNIIQIFEVFENKDKIILVMEYASGGELYDHVSKFGSLPESEARRLFRQITSSVLYCHKHQVAHRDLKLENILLDQDNNAKIADFGLSNYFSDKILLTTFCGSPLYASPEIINGTPYKGPEVDCWSLGILLYTLVYGSMPFDGRDFNRMVRQIKRGAYYEPDTPSTASMLIRNMLRVNPERRADIFDIASHWWLNLEENMPVIQELPENQITDHTPLTERAETMIVQDLADETDVFMEFGHLSNETRKKIEEFRRRRKEAEDYMDQSPIKPKNGKNPIEEMKTEDKSLRGKKDKTEKKEDDPLERLRQIENRLGKTRKQASIDNEKIVKEKEEIVMAKPIVVKTEKTIIEQQPEDPITARNATRAPSFVPVTEKPTIRAEAATSGSRRPSMTSFRIETDSLNMLMNQVLEQMEKGPVSLNMITRIKAHPLYESRPMVKELLESIIEAQPQSVQKQTSKIMPTQEPPRRTTKLENKQKTMEERPWHSVEVGFDPDDNEEIMEQSMISNTTEVTVQDTSFEDSEDGRINEQTTQTEHIEETETDEDDEYTDSEMEDLAEEVEQVEVKVPKEKENLPVTVVDQKGQAPPPDPTIQSVQYLDAFDRGLIKRQSKGKYQQHQHVDMYGRGVSTECEEPNLSRKLHGGPQPHPRHSPFLFNKAKKILMEFPGAPGPLNLENELIERRKKEILNNNVDQRETSPIVSYVGSVPPRTPPPLNESESESEEDAESEEEEESEDEIPMRNRTKAIIGEVRRDGDKISTSVELAGRRTSFMQSAPASIHASMSPEPRNTANSKYLVTIAELKKPIEPKPYSRIHQSTVEKKIHDREANLKEELREISAINSSKKEATPPAPPPVTPTEAPEEGKESWETAAAYIRRKNRERRFRNRTIGSPEEITSLRTDRPSVGADVTDVSNGYHHHTYEYPTSNVGLSTYTSSRYDEDTINNRPMSPTYRYQPREKSYDYLDNHDSRLSAYTVGDTKSYYTSNASPSYTRKFEPDNNMQSWITEPRKFEVYKTRAERDREMNTMHTTPTAANSYRPSTYYSVGGDRNSTYQTRAESSYKPSTNNDNLYAYKRNTYEFDRSVTPGTDYTSHLPTSVLDSPTGGRISARRVQSALTENDKRSYIRSKSMERKAAMDNQFDYLRSNRITPEISNDYTYINYHDSSNGRNSQTRDSQQPKSILKNKQFDTDHRASSTTNDTANSHVRSVFDRLRRHLSMEKSTSPQRQKNQMVGSQGHSDILSQGSKGDDSPRKKRSLLSFNRRKTSEVRLGSDGKLVTNNGIDEYKRPSSPIDRIKSVFRKDSTNNTTTSDYYMPSRFTSTNSTVVDKQYNRYPTTNVANTARDNYVPQFRKYPGSASRDTNALLNRYSYTNGLTEQRRHWYDDPDLY